MKITPLNKTPAQYLKGVGPEISKLLEKCHLHTVQDVLFHLPFRYQDRTKLTQIAHCGVGEWVVVEGVIIAIDTVKRRMIITLNDDSGTLKLMFFHLSAYSQKSSFMLGKTLRCYGEVKYTTFGKTLIHPEYQFIDPAQENPIEETLTPIYPSTEGLTQARWRKITEQALLLINDTNCPDYLGFLAAKSDSIKFKSTMTLQEALRLIHRPKPHDNVEQLLLQQHPAQLRLAFEELLSHHLSLKIKREQIREYTAPPFDVNFAKEALQKFRQIIGFTLTSAQEKVFQETCQELSNPYPMLKLIQGDVGCGKTVLAAMCAIMAACHGFQTAFMAPTELLSEQHAQNFSAWLEPLGLKVLCLNQKIKPAQRKIILEAIKSDAKAIVIGTHALFQESVEFCRLGLVIIDEQHRFGVEQRLALKQKGLSPHQLMMTATPIPRSLAMTCYADLSHSVIDELPPNRTPVKTVVIPQTRREEMIERIHQAHQQKKQIYWVCTLIEESEVLQCQAAQTTAQILQQALPELNVALIHGKLKPLEKEKIMADFKNHKIDLLVATTVIEVGVDVPNASVMIIENAERLGLSQLHQLRGRVGRGSVESYCILLYQSPLSSSAQERLRVMREFQDGFKIAEKDLQLRGPGELLGTRQTGVLHFRVADLVRDHALFGDIQKTADIILKQFPELAEPIIQRWLGDIQKFQEV